MSTKREDAVFHLKTALQNHREGNPNLVHLGIAAALAALESTGEVAEDARRMANGERLLAQQETPSPEMPCSMSTDGQHQSVSYGARCSFCNVPQQETPSPERTPCQCRKALERLRGAGDRKVLPGSVMLSAPFFDSVLEALASRCSCDPLPVSGRIVVECHKSGYRAYRQDRPKTWEFGKTYDESIGRLIVTYALAWPDEWPGLSVEDRTGQDTRLQSEVSVKPESGEGR